MTAGFYDSWDFDAEIRVIESKNGQFIVMVEDDLVLPVTVWLNPVGEECGPNEAIYCVAGTDEFGWLTIEIHEPHIKAH